MYAVIMAGGQGSRLWPLSRINKPKQFHQLLSDKSLLQETFGRLTPIFPTKDVFIATTKDYFPEVRKHLPEIAEKNYILEPALLGNAGSCALTSLILNKRNPDSPAIFLPSDHVIKDLKNFYSIIEFAERLIEKNPTQIITIGIKPTKPDTNLGYIEIGDQAVGGSEMPVFKVKSFREKPDYKSAKKFTDSWQYLWNSGIFIWKPSSMLNYIEDCLPNTHKVLDRISRFLGRADEGRAIDEEYKNVDRTSIDYGVLEKIKDILVIPGDFGWSDIGNWTTFLDYFSELHQTDLITRGNHIGLDDKNSLIISNGKLIATYGLKNIIAVDSHDAILICDRNKASDLKSLLDKIRDEGKHLYL